MRRSVNDPPNERPIASGEVALLRPERHTHSDSDVWGKGCILGQAWSVDAYIDSPVLAGHLLKGHRVKADHLRPLVERVRQLLDLFSSWSLARVPRALNVDADKLANRGIDDAIKQGATNS